PSPRKASSQLKEVYNPKAVIPHAASLHQACAHCAISPTAASRRSLGRVSVPVWPVTLSGRLPVKALVGHYPTNKLIGRESIQNRKSFQPTTMRWPVLSSIRPSFPGLSQSQGQVTHVILTRSPLIHPQQAGSFSVRLACVKHAASVHPEPGSNSPYKNYMKQVQPNRPGRTKAQPHAPPQPSHGGMTPRAPIQTINGINQTSHTTESSNNHPPNTNPTKPAGPPSGRKKPTAHNTKPS